MTRILATGDTQIGATTVTLESQANVLEQIADAAIREHVDLVLHGGDVFEGPIVTPEQLALFAGWVAKLRAHGIPVVAVSGNGTHDQAMRAVNALAIFAEIPGVTIACSPMNIQAAGVTISCLPWTSTALLTASRNGGDRDATHDHAAALLGGIAQDLHDQADQMPNILLAHWSISGASLPTGLPVDQLREPVIEWADLDAIGFDAVVAAHIHKAQRLDDPALGDTTPGVYVGSPQPLSHGEGGYEHGVWLLDVEAGEVSLVFLPIEAPRFVTIDLDPEDLGGDVYKIHVRYRASREQDSFIDKESFRRDLLAAGASRVTIEPNITREVRARDERMTQELSDLDALALYCEAQGIDTGMAERMGDRLREWIAV